MYFKLPKVHFQSKDNPHNLYPGTPEDIAVPTKYHTCCFRPSHLFPSYYISMSTRFGCRMMIHTLPVQLAFSTNYISLLARVLRISWLNATYFTNFVAYLWSMSNRQLSSCTATGRTIGDWLYKLLHPAAVAGIIVLTSCMSVSVYPSDIQTTL